MFINNCFFEHIRIKKHLFTKTENVKKTIAFLKQTCYITNSAFYCACLSASNDED
jgi:hypothetical protein